MAIDASIPLQGLLINRNDENLKQQRYQMGQLQMQQAQQDQQNRAKLSDLLPRAMQGDQQAMGEIATIDEGIWSRLNAQQSAALKQNQEKIVLGARIVRQFNPQDQMGWDQARQAAARVGVDISDVPATFDPNYVNQLVTVADALEKKSGAESPSSVREFEYARDQGYTGSFVDFKNQFASPLVFDINGDNAPDLVPRSMATGNGGQNPPTDLPRISGEEDYNQLKPGQRFITPDGQIRVKRGGQSASPTGGFPY